MCVPQCCNNQFIATELKSAGILLFFSIEIAISKGQKESEVTAIAATAGVKIKNNFIQEKTKQNYLLQYLDKIKIKEIKRRRRRRKTYPRPPTSFTLG